MLVAILANNFDPAYLWDIGREREDIECSDDCVV